MKKVDSATESASKIESPAVVKMVAAPDLGGLRAPEIAATPVAKADAPRASESAKPARRSKRSATPAPPAAQTPTSASPRGRGPESAEVFVPSFMAGADGSAPAQSETLNPMEQRLRQAQRERAKAVQKPDGKELWDGMVVKGKAFVTQLIKGKPQLSRSAKDFPINRSLFGRLKRYGPAKVYRLKGYTTIARVKKKRAKDALKRNRNRLIMFGVVALCILIAYFAIDPIPKIKQILYDIGY